MESLPARMQQLRDSAAFRKCGEALVQKWPGVLIAGQQPVEPLVSQFVGGDDLNRVRPVALMPRSSSRDQRRVLHAAGVGSEGGRVHNSQRFVGVGTEPAL